MVADIMLHLSYGVLTQMGEYLSCKQDVAGSNPAYSIQCRFNSAGRVLPLQGRSRGFEALSRHCGRSLIGRAVDCESTICRFNADRSPLCIWSISLVVMTHDSQSWNGGFKSPIGYCEIKEQALPIISGGHCLNMSMCHIKTLYVRNMHHSPRWYGICLPSRNKTGSNPVWCFSISNVCGKDEKTC